MNKNVALKLRDKIRELETYFSNPDREYNHNNETFNATDVIPLSDSVALVTLKKSSGKESNALFFYIKNYWIYFFPTDSHELGIFNYLNNKYRIHLEGFNFDKNFDIKKEKSVVNSEM